MSISDNVIRPKAFCEELTSEQLDIICGIDFAKTKPKTTGKLTLSDDDYLLAIEWQFYCLIELIARLEYGFNDTATDKWDAFSLRKKAKALRKKAREKDTLSDSTPTWYSVHQTVLDDIQDPTNPLKNTSLHKSVIPYKSPIRLFLGRANRLYGNLFKSGTGASSSFLPSWFSLLSIENLIEVILDATTIIRTMIMGQRKVKLIAATTHPHPHQAAIDALNEKAKKVSAWERFKALLFKGSRPTRLANGILWFSLNLTGILLASFFIATAPVSLPIAGLIMTIGALGAYLTLGGTVLDIVIDLFGSIYELFNLSSLSGKLAKKDPDKEKFLNKNILTFVNKELQIKTQESLITRHMRLIVFNAVMCIAMLLILFPPSAPLAIAILGGCALFSLTADVIPTLRLPYTYNNKVDMVRALVVFSLLLLGVSLGVAMMLGAPIITIPMIAAGLALTIGAAGLARRIARIDFDWVKTKFTLLADKIVNLFTRHADSILTTANTSKKEELSFTLGQPTPVSPATSPLMSAKHPPTSTSASNPLQASSGAPRLPRTGSKDDIGLEKQRTKPADYTRPFPARTRAYSIGFFEKVVVDQSKWPVPSPKADHPMPSRSGSTSPTRSPSPALDISV